MKKSLVYILILPLLFVTFGMAQSNHTIEVSSFTVLVPRGWTAEKSDVDSVTLTMDEAQNEEVGISVLCSPMRNDTTLNDAWKKMKSVMIDKKSIISEGEDTFFNTTWKRVEIQETICDEDIRRIICFSIKDGNKWLVQCYGPKDDQKSILKTFNRVKQSLKAK